MLILLNLVPFYTVPGIVWRHFIDNDDRDQSQLINALRQIGAGEQADLIAQTMSRVSQGLSMSAVFEQWLEGADISGLEDLDAAFFQSLNTRFGYNSGKM